VINHVIPAPSGLWQISRKIGYKRVLLRGKGKSKHRLWRIVKVVLTMTRRAVALKMAFAVLQLHGTHWINLNYVHDSLFFVTDDSTSHIPFFFPAYVSQTFITANTPSPNSPTVSARTKLVKNPIVYGLGVSLLELVYGERLLSLATTDECDSMGDATHLIEMAVATRLSKDIERHETPGFALATVSCIGCAFGRPSEYSLDNENYRANFIERVIMPLKGEYDMLFPADRTKY